MHVVLNSWKEIAAYIGRGVRTAQRWERDLAMPVRRPRGKDRSAVIAVPTEIDEWLRKCPTRYCREETSGEAQHAGLLRKDTSGNRSAFRRRIDIAG